MNSSHFVNCKNKKAKNTNQIMFLLIHYVNYIDAILKSKVTGVLYVVQFSKIKCTITRKMLNHPGVSLSE